MEIKRFDISRLSGKKAFDPASVKYEDSIGVIEDELQNTRKSFVKIGWHLKHINEERTFCQDGYEDIFEFAHAKFKMSAGTVNRLINICKQFSVDHDSPELDDRYQAFEPSQLFEMLPMQEEEREEISPDMTVKQIREKKAENKTGKEPSDQLVKKFLQSRGVDLSKYQSVSELREDLYDRYGKAKAMGKGTEPDYECSLRGISLDDHDEMTWLAFAKKAWNLRGSEPQKEQREQKREPGRESGHMDDPPTADPEEKDTSQDVIADGEGAVPEDTGPVSEYPDETALLEEAYSLSQRLFEGIRFSIQNHTLSQIEDYQKWATELRHAVYKLYERYAL